MGVIVLLVTELESEENTTKVSAVMTHYRINNRILGLGGMLREAIT